MMAASRTWNLRLNLDEFNALAASVYTDSDRALLFQGITLGFNGGNCPDGVPSPFLRAYNLGADARQEAEAFRLKMGQNGSRGGRPAHRQDPGEYEPDQGVEEPAGKPEGNQQVNQLVDQQGNQTSTQSTIHNPQSFEQQPTTPAEQRGREASGRMSASEWEPFQEHRELCAVRRTDCDLQLARFRERNMGQTDTDQGWGVRFMQWLGRSRPERAVPAEVVTSPTLEQWIEEGKKLNNSNPKNPEWSWESCEAIWHENQAKGWRYIQDWKSSIRAAYNRFVGLEHQIASRRR